MTFKFFSLVLLSILNIQNVNSFEVRKNAVIRDDKFNAIIKEVTLTDLLNNKCYEGKYFKIVLGKSEKAISFDSPDSLQLKAATTYYHLNKARNYFDKVVLSNYVHSLPQITIRLDLSNVFNEVGHFANDNLDPQFNNALTVPAGVGYEPKKIEPWGIEIWFRQSKEIDIRSFPYSQRSDGSVKAALHDFRNQNHLNTLQNFINLILQGEVNGGYFDINGLMRLAGTSIILEAIYQSSNVAADFFSQKIYRLDSALVPEIIYHEFSHVALSEHLELSHSSPVNEGVADFFASQIANSKSLATKIKDYNLFSGKEVRKKQQYRIDFEQNNNANSDFVFGLLWNVGQLIGKERESKFIFDLSSKLSTNSSIKEDLLSAMIDTCNEDCKNPFSDKIVLYRFFDSKNF